MDELINGGRGLGVVEGRRGLGWFVYKSLLLRKEVLGLRYLIRALSLPIASFYAFSFPIMLALPPFGLLVVVLFSGLRS